jgi:general stress protein 26
VAERRASARIATRRKEFTMKPIEKLVELQKQFSTAMLITHLHGERFHARPMAVADVSDNGRISFFTSIDSPKVDEVLAESDVLVICQKDSSLCLSIEGSAVVTQNSAQMAKAWKETFTIWYPNGLKDPQLALITVVPNRAEYWDNTGLNRIKYLYEAARAYMSGDTPHVEEGEQHGVVNVSR